MKNAEKFEKFEKFYCTSRAQYRAKEIDEAAYLAAKTAWYRAVFAEQLAACEVAAGSPWAAKVKELASPPGPGRRSDLAWAGRLASLFIAALTSDLRVASGQRTQKEEVADRQLAADREGVALAFMDLRGVDLREHYRLQVHDSLIEGARIDGRVWDADDSVSACVGHFALHRGAAGFPDARYCQGPSGNGYTLGGNGSWHPVQSGCDEENENPTALSAEEKHNYLGTDAEGCHLYGPKANYRATGWSPAFRKSVLENAGVRLAYEAKCEIWRDEVPDDFNQGQILSSLGLESPTSPAIAMARIFGRAA